MSSAVIVQPPPAARISREHSPFIDEPSLRLIRVNEATPADAAAWDHTVARHRDATVFHNFGWRRAVEDVFGHQAHYLAAWRDERMVGVLPMFRVGGPLVGRTLVSVPYGVGGGILADDDGARDALYDAAVDLADRLKCTGIEFRSARAALSNPPVSDLYYGFRKVLPDCITDVLGFLPRKARAVARNARDKHKLTVHYGDEYLRTVWKLYTVNMRRLASLAYPYRFFQQLISHHPGRHLVSLVCWKDKPVAGLVTFMFRDTVYPYFYGANEDARRCGAAHFVYYSLMEWAVRARYRVFDFGRTRRDNTGGVDFKRFCGFEPRPLGYQTYVAPGRKSRDLTPRNPKLRLVRRLWPNLPLCVTTPLGGELSKYIPG